MCKTTKGTQVAATEKLVEIAPNAVPVTPDFSLQKYLENAYAQALTAGKLGAQPADDSTAKLHVPISLFAHVQSGGNHHYAGVHDDEMHFSASLLKVAAMYAAFNLRAEARALATSGGFNNQNAFFTALGQQFNSTDAAPAIQNAGPSVGLKPKYPDILTVTGFGGGALQVEFNPSFSAPLATDHALFSQDPNKASHMYRMIVPSDNSSAAECIRRLGYAYINVKLMNAGFFDLNTSNGIWLAADFAGGPRVEVDSVNDAKAAQVTTSRQMARMFSLIRLGTLIDSTSSNEMRLLLKEAAAGQDSPWISRFGDRLFKFGGVKIGLANLKPNTPPMGPNVHSEGVLLKWKGDAADLAKLNLTGDIAVCWQNLRASAFNTGVPAIAEMIEKAFSDFLSQTPI